MLGVYSNQMVSTEGFGGMLKEGRAVFQKRASVKELAEIKKSTLKLNYYIWLISEEKEGATMIVLVW